ncbi:uncharacterized protein CLUP02_04026 [Colletotrichum lupini]|uniref:Uncharacterized protein n=1 Tax=Colletotrichum lupini TaxID=145971 RepID=A0A9Q8WCQ9_9PEZI|nr:uncharacterized protein CLUP02_04026 [Colletotrichum lupini]UQC78549.1 hypothetical protein CLUP02_04026 [Colletotrichum lupini]
MFSNVHFHHNLSRVCLFFVLAINAKASNETNTTNQETVGWRAGPGTRGTLNLVWSCAITIFACTWTVTHLNLPGPKDTTFQKLCRRVKWMAINIIFPEFILSKAICDLRQALDELRQFGEVLPHIRHQITSVERLEVPYSLTVDEHRFWKVEYPPYYKIIYRSLYLKLPSLNSATTVSHAATTESAPENVLNAETRPTGQQAETRLPSRVHEVPQLWTIVHSYYAQMGGILIPWAKGSSGWAYKVLTATKLTPEYEWDSRQGHPLKYLILGRASIQDKSKADWLVKILAVTQILLLVLNVVGRGVAKLPVTQLELATVAFAIMAILTYWASWWKPKDISVPTHIRYGPYGEWVSTPKMRQLSLWFRSPTKAADIKKRRDLHEGNRIPNDATWIGSRSSSMAIFLATSSLVFGGVHCLAWNFEFPSETELMAWRIGCIITATLPTVTLGISFLLSHLSVKKFPTQRQRIIIEELDKLPVMSQDWWNRLLGLQEQFRDLNSTTVYEPMVSNVDESNDWNHRVTENFEGSALERSWKDRNIGVCRDLVAFRNQWTKALEHTKLEADDVEDWYNTGMLLRHCWRILSGPNFHKFWRRLETCDGKSPDCPTPGLQWLSYIEQLSNAVEIAESRCEKELVFFQKIIPRASEVLSIISYVIYLVARLLTMVLLFTTLRSAPVKVYQTVTWLRY